MRRFSYPTLYVALAFGPDHLVGTMFELAANGVALMNEDLVCTDANPAFCMLAGRPRNEVVGRHISRLVVADGAVCAHINKALRTEGQWEGTLPILPGERNATLEWRIVAGSSDGTRIATTTDISEGYRTEADVENLLARERAARGEAERLNRIKDEFLATLSHELRNPLSAILGWVNVLKRTPSVTPEILKGLEVIERNSRLQTHLVADLLDYAGMRFGKTNLEIIAINPAVALRATQAVLAPIAQAREVTLEWDVANDDAHVMGDDARLQQIVWNLVSNAIKFTPAGGHVSVTARATDGQYEIAVTDTGRGISANFLPHLFDRFTQQQSGLNKSFTGLGLGLTIVKHLVDVHAGTIEASSLGQGYGSRFTVRLPLTDERPAPRTIEAGAVLDGLTVLLVEDDADTRGFISRVLLDAGATVAEAASADEALTVLQTSKPSVLVSDIGMAKKDGYQLIRTVRETGHSAQQLPAIALTAFSRAQDRADAIKAGFQVHLIKPIAADRLTAAIAALARPTV